MGHYSVADAKNNLSELIARAERGEEVVITRHGSPVAKLSEAKPRRRPMSPERIAEMRSRLVEPSEGYEGAVDAIRRMRDQDP
jgi:prevent-host-death family protein